MVLLVYAISVHIFFVGLLNHFCNRIDTWSPGHRFRPVNDDDVKSDCIQQINTSVLIILKQNAL